MSKSTNGTNSKQKPSKAPLSAADRLRLVRDAVDLKGTAARKNIDIDLYTLRREALAAKSDFELGCWLYYYSRRVGQSSHDGFLARVDCLRKLILAEKLDPNYDFYTVFDFGEREFDTIFEMGDASDVITHLRNEIPSDGTGRIKAAFEYFGWPIEMVDAPESTAEDNINTMAQRPELPQRFA